MDVVVVVGEVAGEEKGVGVGVNAFALASRFPPP